MPTQYAQTIAYDRPPQTILTLSGTGAVGVSYELASSSPDAISGEMISMPPIRVALLPGNTELSERSRRTIVPGSVLIAWNGKVYYDRNGTMYRDLDPATGSGVVAGDIDYATGGVSISGWGAGSNSAEAPVVLGCLSRPAFQATASVRFRCPGAPLRPQSLIVRASATDGSQITGNSQADGTITGTHIRGAVDYATGIVGVQFGEALDDNDAALDLSHRAEPWYSALTSRYDVSATATPDWRCWRPIPVEPSSVLFNVVIYTSMPLDAGLIGIDAVRLPADGKVPVFQRGYVVVIHDTAYQTLATGLSAGQVVSLGRGLLAEVILRDQGGQLVPADRYTVQKVAGTVTMANPLNLAGYAEPLIAEHRVEDMALVVDAQISGELTLSRTVTHDYTAANSYVSSALLFGDLSARLSMLFEQQTWTGVWSDTRIGAATTASFNRITYPPVLTNAGAISERWALIFTTASAFSIVGESVGVIGSGNINEVCAPNNPVSDQPYFEIPFAGWGAGWAAGNVLRFNTIGALAPIWLARTTRQSQDAETNDQFRLMVRGDAD